ncbi:TonB-dependent receptor [Algimonas ampicilliniresistens]|uniref:TonB-dependent receptor n=1 Tax=Algimonas ampicilliniresistens TaxID=1298735 RepID=A0ABQ5V4Z9_9PROT|nr:TonB-dependent receptor [Algimonas ampicilliniresistens]GLQ22167.1 TonB-dependent receptor [Algimonas ampicilliniresistens]
MGIGLGARDFTIIAVVLASTAAPVFARQDVAVPAEQAANLDSFAPSFFTQFQPNTALDMVERIPGFTLRSGDDERGFGVADTNFLINGRRPSTKSQDAEDILSRIPAGTVVRIEVLDGASLDIPGLSGQVVNVVARAVELSGRWRYSARFEEGTEPQILEGEVVLSGRRGDLGFSVGLKNRQFTLTEDSVERFFDSSGALIEDRTEDVYLRNVAPSANLNLTWTPTIGRFAGHVANLNASIEKDNENNGLREIFTAIDPTRTSGESFADIGEDEIQIEIGGDYALPLPIAGLDGTLKLIALNQLDDGESGVVFVSARDGSIPLRTKFSEDFKEGELIGRAEYGFKAGSGHDVQISVEYAYNFLESATTFQNSFTAPIIDEVRVEEDRFNARITDSWQISSDLSLQTSIGAEYSSLQVVNPLSDARNFFRPKGFAAVSYRVSDRYTLRAKADRSVGQLDFDTFVSTRNLVDNLLTSGNAEIKPSQSTELSLEFERTDDKLLSGRIRPYLELIEDPIDRILLSNNAEAPGNLDSATRYGIEANATLLFDTLGVPGLRLEASGGIGESEIDDPLTGEQRQINFNEEYSYSLFARYDIPQSNIALTGRVNNDESSPFYRLDDIRTIDVRRPFLSLGLIHKNVFGMQLTISGTNLLDNTVIQERDRFLTPDRRLGPLIRSERFERQRGRRLSITLTDTF